MIRFLFYIKQKLQAFKWVLHCLYDRLRIIDNFCDSQGIKSIYDHFCLAALKVIKVNDPGMVSGLITLRKSSHLPNQFHVSAKFSLDLRTTHCTDLE